MGHLVYNICACATPIGCSILVCRGLAYESSWVGAVRERPIRTIGRAGGSRTAHQNHWACRRFANGPSEPLGVQAVREPPHAH